MCKLEDLLVKAALTLSSQYVVRLWHLLLLIATQSLLCTGALLWVIGETWYALLSFALGILFAYCFYRTMQET